MREVNRILGSVPNAGNKPALPKALLPSSPQAVLRSLLSIEYRHLNPENEMKKIFGSRVVQAETRHHQHHRRGHHGQRHRAPVKSAHSILAPKGQWPNPNRHGAGLAMRFVDSDASDGSQFFAFEHSKEYQRVQEDFYLAVQTMNPDAIVVCIHISCFNVV